MSIGNLPRYMCRRVVEQDIRQPLRLRFGHDAARVRVRDELGVERLHRRVAARVVLMQMRINDVADRLLRDLRELRHDAVVVGRELVVDESTPSSETSTVTLPDAPFLMT